MILCLIPAWSGTRATRRKPGRGHPQNRDVGGRGSLGANERSIGSPRLRRSLPRNRGDLRAIGILRQLVGITGCQHPKLPKSLVRRPLPSNPKQYLWLKYIPHLSEISPIARYDSIPCCRADRPKPSRPTPNSCSCRVSSLNSSLTLLRSGSLLFILLHQLQRNFTPWYNSLHLICYRR